MSKLTPPKYAPDAVATNRGWETSSGELLVSFKGLKDKLDAAKKPAKSVVTPKAKVVKVEDVVVEESTDDSVDFESMTKDELESWARDNLDLELDKRKTKKSLIEEIKATQ
jgi:hypothetical protein